MAERIVLHAGSHKSGTTALQHSFAINREFLKSHGVVYPASSRNAHHRAAWGLTGRVWGWRNNGGKQIPESAWRRFARKVNGSKGTVLISSEFFVGAEREHIERIRQDFGSTPIEIVFTSRPFIKILASSYQQYLKYGVRIRYDKWLDEMFHRHQSSKVTPSFWPRSQVDQVVGKWAEVFGPENVFVILADESAPQFIFDQFIEILRLPSGSLTPPPVGANRSMTLEETQLLFLINGLYDRSNGWDEYRAMIRDGYVRFLADHTSPREGASRLPTPSWAVEEGLALTHKHLEGVKRFGVQVRGDAARYLSATVPTGEYEPPSEIDMEVAAKFLASYRYQIIQHFPLRVVLREVRRRVRRSMRRAVKGI